MDAENFDYTAEEVLEISEVMSSAIGMPEGLAAFMAAIAMAIQDVVTGDCPCKNCEAIRMVAANVPI